MKINKLGVLDVIVTCSMNFVEPTKMKVGMCIVKLAKTILISEIDNVKKNKPINRKLFLEGANVCRNDFLKKRIAENNLFFGKIRRNVKPPIDYTKFVRYEDIIRS